MQWLDAISKDDLRDVALIAIDVDPALHGVDWAAVAACFADVAALPARRGGAALLSGWPNATSRCGRLLPDAFAPPLNRFTASPPSSKEPHVAH